MAIDPNTLMPYPDSYAAYAAAWVKHFKDTGRAVKYFGIMPEAQTYIGWSPPGDAKRIANFVKLFNAAYTKMHQADSQVMVSTDCSLEKHFFSYFLNYGVGIDFLDFHKYDGWKYPQYTDAEMFTMAEGKYFVTDYTAYSISEARQKWLEKHGKTLPAILSEGNFNAAYADGADPRIPQMAGAVRTALVARAGMLNGLMYDLYYRLSSSASYEQSRPTGGTGFGMINSDNNKPWYPYLVLKMIATSLSPGDKILQTSISNNNYFRAIAWNHNGQVTLLLISKTKQAYDMKIEGLTGTINYSKVDESISWKTPAVQSGQYKDYLTLNGYAVALFRGNGSSLPPPNPLEDGFESGSFSAWNGTTTTSGETATVTNTLAHHGTYGAKFASNGGSGYENSYVFKNVGSNEIYVRGYFYMSQSGIAQDNDKAYLLTLAAGSNNVAYAGWKRTGGSVKWQLAIRDGSGYATVYSGTTPIVEKWYCVELHWKKGTTNGLGELWVDGAKIATITAKNTATYGDVSQVRFGLTELYGCTSTIAYCDCTKVSNAYIGPES
jgi:hypothetical protein